MATYALSAAQEFPDGVQVGAYPASAIPSGSNSGPGAAAVNTQTQSGGSVTFSGLEDGERYAAGGVVSGSWRYVFFQLDDPTTLSLDEHAAATTNVHGIEDTESIVSQEELDEALAALPAVDSPLTFALPTISTFVAPQSHTILTAEFTPTDDFVEQQFDVHAAIVGTAMAGLVAYDGPASALPFSPTYQGGALPTGVTATRLGGVQGKIGWPENLSHHWISEVETGEPWATEIVAAIVGAQNGTSLGSGKDPLWIDCQRVAGYSLDKRFYSYAVTSNADGTASVIKIGAVTSHFWDDVIATVTLPDGGDGDVAVNTTGTFAAVANYAADTVTIISLPGPTGDAAVGVVGTYALPGGSEGPMGLCYDLTGTLLYVVCQDTEKIARASVDTTTGVPTFGSSWSATAGSAPLRGMFRHASGHFIVACPGNEKVSTFAPSTGVIVDSVSLGTGANPNDIALAPNGTDIWVACPGSNTIKKLAYPTMGSVVTSLSPGYSPVSLAVTADGYGLIAAMNTASSGHQVSHYNLEAAGTPRYVEWVLGGAPTCIRLTDRADILFTIPSTDAVQNFHGANFTIGNDGFTNSHGHLTVTNAEAS